MDCVNHMAEELDPHILDLAKDQSGSHALRTLTVVLNGLQPVAKKQFTTSQLKKQKQRKKKKAAAAALLGEKPKSNANDVFKLYDGTPSAGSDDKLDFSKVDFPPPPSFDAVLCTWASYFCGMGHGLLTDTVLKNRHAAPFVQVLVLALHKNTCRPLSDAPTEPTAEGDKDDEDDEENGESDVNKGQTTATAALKKICATVMPTSVAADVAAAPARFEFLAKHESGSRVLEVLLRFVTRCWCCTVAVAFARQRLKSRSKGSCEAFRFVVLFLSVCH